MTTAKTYIGSGSNGVATVANETSYWCLGSAMKKSTTETNRDVLFRSAGTLSNLYVRLTVNGITSNSTFRTRKNAANGGQSVSLTASTTGEFTDSSGTDSISAGDKLNYQFVPGAATNTITFTVQSCIFQGTSDTVTRTLGNFDQAVTTASTTWFAPLDGDVGAAVTTETNAKQRMRKAGTLKNGHAHVTTARAQATTVRLRKNGANGNTNISCTGGATGYYEDTVNTDTVSAGEDWNWSITTGTGVDTLNIIFLAADFVSTNGDGLAGISHMTTVAFTDGATRFLPISGTLNNSISTEADSKADCRIAGDYSELTCLVTQNDLGAGVTTPVKLRKNGADTSLSCSLTGNTTGVFSDSSNTVTLVATDEVNYSVAPPAVAGTHTVSITNIVMSTHVNTSTNYTTSLATETVSVSESLTRLLGAKRNPVETTSISETPTRMLSAFRTLPTETTTISESLVKSKGQPSRLSTETITVNETLARMLAANRPLSTETTAVSESIARMLAASRALSDTIAISESLVKSKGQTRNPIETVTIGESLTRMLAANRPLSTEIITVGENLARLLAATRAINENTAVSDSLNRLVTYVRALATETVTINESLTRMLAANRTLSDTVVVSDNVARMLAATRALATQTVAVSENLTRLLTANRTLQDSVTVGENLTRQLAASRALATEITNVSDQLTRMLAATRVISQTTAISDSINTTYTPGGGGPTNYQRTITETTTISESLLRMLAATRALAAENTAISENLQRSVGNNRAINENVTVSGGTLTRLLSATRALLENTSIGESLLRMLGANRTLSESVPTSENIQRNLGANRPLNENVSIGDTITRKLSAFRTLLENTSISDILDYVYTPVGAVHYVVHLVENVSVSDSVKTWIEYIKIITGSTRGKIDAEGRPERRQTPGWFRNSFYTLTRKRRKGIGEGIG